MGWLVGLTYEGKKNEVVLALREKLGPIDRKEPVQKDPEASSRLNSLRVEWIVVWSLLVLAIICIQNTEGLAQVVAKISVFPLGFLAWALSGIGATAFGESRQTQRQQTPDVSKV